MPDTIEIKSVDGLQVIVPFPGASVATTFSVTGSYISNGKDVTVYCKQSLHNYGPFTYDVSDNCWSVEVDAGNSTGEHTVHVTVAGATGEETVIVNVNGNLDPAAGKEVTIANVP